MSRPFVPSKQIPFQKYVVPSGAKLIEALAEIENAARRGCRPLVYRIRRRPSQPKQRRPTMARNASRNEASVKLKLPVSSPAR